jgi:hypothetical protein
VFKVGVILPLSADFQLSVWRRWETRTMKSSEKLVSFHEDVSICLDAEPSARVLDVESWKLSLSSPCNDVFIIMLTSHTRYKYMYMKNNTLRIYIIIRGVYVGTHLQIGTFQYLLVVPPFRSFVANLPLILGPVFQLPNTIEPREALASTHYVDVISRCVDCKAPVRGRGISPQFGLVCVLESVKWGRCAGEPIGLEEAIFWNGMISQMGFEINRFQSICISELSK